MLGAFMAVLYLSLIAAGEWIGVATPNTARVYSICRSVHNVEKIDTQDTEKDTEKAQSCYYPANSRKP